MFLFLFLFPLLQLSASSGGPAGGWGWGFWQRWQGNYVCDRDALTHTNTHTNLQYALTHSHCLRRGWHCFIDRKHKQTNEMTPSSPPISSPVQFFSLPEAQTYVQRLYNLLTLWKFLSVDMYTANFPPFSFCFTFLWTFTAVCCTILSFSFK